MKKFLSLLLILTLMVCAVPSVFARDIPPPDRPQMFASHVINSVSISLSAAQMSCTVGLVKKGDVTVTMRIYKDGVLIDESEQSKTGFTYNTFTKSGNYPKGDYTFYYFVSASAGDELDYDYSNDSMTII